MSKQTEVQAYLEKLSPMEVVDDKSVELQFIKSFEAIHGTNGQAQYEKEKFYFMKLLSETPALQECTRMSLYGCFLEIGSLGLSLDNTSKPLCYLLSRNAKVGNNYEKRAYLMVTGFGELVQRQRAKQIKYADNPIIVYDGDTFQPGIDANGKKFVRYEMAFPRKSKKVIAAFIKITRPDNSIDYQWLLEDDFNRLKEYSARSNSKWVDVNGKKERVKGDPNALYTSVNGGIDPGFLENKMIKHAFDSFPKVKTGSFSILETQEQNIETAIDTQAEDITHKYEPEETSAFGTQPEPETNGIIINDETGAF